MNAFHDALEELWVVVQDEHPGTPIVPIKQVFQRLFDVEDSMDMTDSNHPYNRFGRSGSSYERRHRLKDSFNAAATELDAEIVSNNLFENTSSPSCNRVSRVLEKWRAYVLTILDSDSDSDSD